MIPLFPVSPAWLLIVLAPGTYGAELLRNGDIVFQQSASTQSDAIRLATQSRYTHVGVVLFERGKPMVLEAIGKTSFTPYAAWVARGVGGHVVVKRLNDAAQVLTAETIERMHTLAREMRGTLYDWYFAWDDERLYCSELVHKLYDRTTDVSLGRLQRLGDLHLEHPLVRKKLAERFGAELPLEEQVVSPQALFEDERLVTVYENAPPG